MSPQMETGENLHATAEATKDGIVGVQASFCQLSIAESLHTPSIDDPVDEEGFFIDYLDPWL